jgi:hypothetical protein
MNTITKHKIALYVPFCGGSRQQNCRRNPAGIVIALKRNGAYSGIIQVTQLGFSDDR